MAALPDPILREIREQLGLRAFIRARELPQGNEDSKVADATQKFILQGSRSKRFILIIANSVSPLMVRRNVERMRMARSLLHNDTKGVIELPLIEGEYQDRSYALWTMRKPLSSNRVLFKVEKTLISPSIFRWINNIAAQTLHHVNSTELVSYIDHLLSVSA